MRPCAFAPGVAVIPRPEKGRLALRVGVVALQPPGTDNRSLGGRQVHVDLVCLVSSRTLAAQPVPQLLS